jgi:myo-inositol-1(or 4)-monophosphatase
MSPLTDLEVAEQAARAAARVALDARGEVVRAEVKDAPTDVVSEVDRAAEAAAIAIIASERPDDGFLGEEGAAKEGERTWVIDALDGTLNYLLGLRGRCAAVALDGIASAVCDPVSEELFSAARGDGTRLNGAPIVAPAGPRSLDRATIATFLHQPKRVLPGAVHTLTRLLETAGSVRITGSGTLELAYVAAGRLHGWIQPATFRWDWVPGALLVSEANGHTRTTRTDPYWCIAAANRQLLDGLTALTTQ